MIYTVTFLATQALVHLEYWLNPVRKYNFKTATTVASVMFAALVGLAKVII